MTFVITQSCCNDTSCVDVCPVDCIHPTPDEPDFGTAEMLYIDPAECIDCGACVEACPVSAVHADHELPDRLAAYAGINADYFSWMGDTPEPVAHPKPAPAAQAQKTPLRVAVVGTGPAGWFVTEELARTRRAAVEITVLDRLPTPFGLVRHGVAPDHLNTKEVTGPLSSIASHRSVTVRLNVDVGKDVTHEQLLEHHHAVVYATGAGAGRDLGVPGEDLSGSVSAADLVGWYNGHPDHVDVADRHVLAEALAEPRAVIVGNGNVALDIARLLLADPETLQASDTAAHALSTLGAGRVAEVVVLGRRGAEHAAFTTPELLALVDNPSIDVIVDPADLETLPGQDNADRTSATFAAAQKAALLRRALSLPQVASKRLVLRFGVTPRAILGDGRVGGVELECTGGNGTVEVLPAGLVIRATGYRGSAVPGVPFDEQSGRFAHEGGRVIDPASGALVSATYTTGWAKRGSSGVIGSNRGCAAESATSLLDDYLAGALADPVGGAGAFDALLAMGGTTVVDFAGWKRLDAHELGAGRAAGRPRVKVVDLDEQARVATAP